MFIFYHNNNKDVIKLKEQKISVCTFSINKNRAPCFYSTCLALIDIVRYSKLLNTISKKSIQSMDPLVLNLAHNMYLYPEISTFTFTHLYNNYSNISIESIIGKKTHNIKIGSIIFKREKV